VSYFSLISGKRVTNVVLKISTVLPGRAPQTGSLPLLSSHHFVFHCNFNIRSCIFVRYIVFKYTNKYINK
jgi:hypothetical protein